MSLPKIEDPVQFLVDNGILFEMNRQVLHPLGLELQLGSSEEGRASAVELHDNRESVHPISFSPEAFEAGRRRYEAYLNEKGRRNMQKRRTMGMVIQTGPNTPRRYDEPSAD